MDKLLELEASAGGTGRKRARRAKPAASVKGHAAVSRWATFGVALILVLSACLNSYANSQHSPVAWAGWLMGLAVPVIVLVLAKVAGENSAPGGRRWRGSPGRRAWRFCSCRCGTVRSPSRS